MAWSASKVFAKTLLAASGGTAFNLGTDALKAALYNNSIAPDNTVATAALTQYNGAASQWVVANEVSQAGQWAAGGVALGSQAWTQTTNVAALSAANTASASAATLAAVFGCLVYDSTVSNDGLCYNYFGGSNSVTAGTFTVVWNASGVLNMTT